MNYIFFAYYSRSGPCPGIQFLSSGHEILVDAWAHWKMLNKMWIKKVKKWWRNVEKIFKNVEKNVEKNDHAQA
jgi:hypothetical protein